MPPKILIIPARRHIIESYCDYLIRHLSDEFYFEMGYPIDPNSPSPLEKNPDDFDLIYPQFDTHWFMDPPEKYAHKIANVMLEMAGPRQKTAVVAATATPIQEAIKAKHLVRFGIDTDLFKPFPMVRTDSKFRIGFMGNIQTPRRYIKDLFMPLHDIVGARLMVFPTTWLKHTRPDEIESMGGQNLVDSISGGDCWVTGLPNIYNQLDVYVRCDLDLGYQFSVMEAAACGIPVVTTDSGIGKELCDAGGGIYVGNGDGSWTPENLDRVSKDIRQAVLLLKDNEEMRLQMGAMGREFVTENWTWEKQAPVWREFFREGVKNAKRI